MILTIYNFASYLYSLIRNKASNAQLYMEITATFDIQSFNDTTESSDHALENDCNYF